MMLYPPVADLINKIGSRYLLVNLVAKRARIIADEAMEKNEPLNKKSVSMAIEEVYTGKLSISEESGEMEVSKEEPQTESEEEFI